HFLFDIPVEQIGVVIHPESIIHSLVEYVDGSMIAQMSVPDMKYPIQYAMTYPERMPTMMPPFDFTKARGLNFIPTEPQKFPCLDLAFEALKKRKSYPCFLNAANEI